MIHPNIAGIVALTSFIGMHAIFGCELARDGSPSRASQELDRDTYAREVAPDLAIEQVAKPAMAKPGAEVTFTLTVTNKRPASAANVAVSDLLPASTTFVSCTSGSSGTCEGSGNDRRIVFESLAGGVSATVTLVATLHRDVASGTRVTNVATVSFEGTDPDMTNNRASSTVTVDRP
jgi:uncharacterized repeat protein (TIGR01451 family)